MDDVILRVEDLHTHFFARDGLVKAVNGVDLEMRRGRILGLVGESGCGKTVTALSILKLVPYPGQIVSGSVYLEGRDLYQLSAEDLRQVRGRDISMIFQDPVTGLNPVLPIGQQVGELLSAHTNMSKGEVRDTTLRILQQVGLPDPVRVAEQYAFQLSGGMCQRVMIGIATALNPKVLIADEPTTALDVTVQAQILDQILQLKEERGTSVLLITHDLGVIAQVADDVAVFYAGAVVEYGSVRDVFAAPLHPYTRALMNALPRVDQPFQHLQSIPGSPPNPMDLEDECPFIPRCNKALTVCRTSPWPRLETKAENHEAACYNPVAYTR